MKDTFRSKKSSRWAYVGEIYGKGRKFGYYVPTGINTNNTGTKTFKKKADALKYAKKYVKK